MRTYNERLANIRSKAKANKRAKQTIVATLVTMTAIALLIYGALFAPPLRSVGTPTDGPALMQPTQPTHMDAPTEPTDVEMPLPTKPAPMEPVFTEPLAPYPDVVVPVKAIKYYPNCYKASIDDNDEFRPMVIRTVAELRAFLDRHYQSDCGLPEKSVYLNRYDDAYFETQSLIVMIQPESNGSNRIAVESLIQMSDGSIQLTLNRILPHEEQIDACEAVCWYVFVGTKEVLEEDVKVTVYYTTAYTGDSYLENVRIIDTYDEWRAIASEETMVLYDCVFFERNALVIVNYVRGATGDEYNFSSVSMMPDGSILIKVDCKCSMLGSEVVTYHSVTAEIGATINSDTHIYVETNYSLEEITPEPPERPENTNLEFWIGQDVANYDFSGHDEVYGWFGAREYLGSGYNMLVDGDGQQIYPEHYVSYLVGAFPDESDGGSFVTNIEICDADVVVYGLTIQSDAEEFEALFRAMGYSVYEKDGTWIAQKNGMTFTFRHGAYLTIRADVTNWGGIIY